MNVRTTARMVGLLFIVATAAGVLSVVALGPPEAGPAPADVPSHLRAGTGALMVLVMAAAIVMIPPMLFGVLKQHNEALALGYVVARVVEVVLLLPAALGPLVLVAVASTVEAGTGGAEGLRLAGVLSRTYDSWGHPASVVFFCIGVVLLNYLLLRSRLVPRLISGWALLAVVPYAADGVLVMLGIVDPSSTLHTLLVAPLAVNEMVLALWLLVKGFNPSAVR